MESTLALKFSDYLSEAGFYLGYGRGASAGDRAWSDRTETQLNRIAASSLRWVYWPSLPPPQGTYEWSFMRPTATITIPANQTTVFLPADFGGFEGRLIVTAADQSQQWPVDTFDEIQLDYEYTRFPGMTGRPRMVAEKVLKGTQITKGTRKEMFVYPTPDQAYTFQFRYYVLPDALTSTHPYHYGGAQHAETFKAAIHAVAELELDDIAQGPRYQQFQSRLMASIGLDRRNKPQSFGKNLDRSDIYPNNWRRRNWGQVAFNGIVYED